MIQLEELKDYFLDELKGTEAGSPRRQLLYLLLSELLQVDNAQQFVFRQEIILEEQNKLLNSIREKI